MTRSGRVAILAATFATLLMSAQRADATPTTIVAVDATETSIPGDPNYLVVRVTDENGDPVPDPDSAGLTWAGPTTGPRAEFEVDTFPEEAADGKSVILLTGAKGGPGTYALTATFGALTPVTFNVTNLPVSLGSVDSLGGGHQSVLVNAAFPEPLQLRVNDAYGSPAAGVTVTLTPPAAGASVVVGTNPATSDEDGLVSFDVTANATAGAYVVTITADGPDGDPSVDVHLSNLATAPASVAMVGGDTQTAPPLGYFVQPLEVVVKDAGDNPIPNAVVSFTAPVGEPGIGAIVASPAATAIAARAVDGGGRVFTDANGVARAIVHASGGDGGFTASAQPFGLGSTVDFQLTIDDSLPAKVLANGDESEINGHTVKPGQTFTDLAFRVFDIYDAPLAGATVHLTAPATGASVTPAQTDIVTDAEGWAHTTGVANNVAGTYALRGTLDGVINPGRLYLQNRPVGYAVGEQLANPTGYDDQGQAHTLRSFLSGGSWLMLDVCAGWCPPCKLMQAENVEAAAALAAKGITLHIVPLVEDTATVGQPSTQAFAAAWKDTYNLTEPVLHLGGQYSGPMFDTAWFVQGVQQPGFPTLLLVSPSGRIVGRHVGGLDKDGILDFFKVSSNPTTPKLSIVDASVVEGAAGATRTLNVKVRLTGRSRTPVSIDYTTYAGTADESVDFEPVSGTLTFARTIATSPQIKLIKVPIHGDADDENDETFSVALVGRASGGAVVTRGFALATIVDDDGP